MPDVQEIVVNQVNLEATNFIISTKDRLNSVVVKIDAVPAQPSDCQASTLSVQILKHAKHFTQTQKICILSIQEFVIY